MKNIGKWILGAAVLAGGLGIGATTAQAAQLRVYAGGGPAAYIPPCPGPGYVWVAGYYNGGYWVPGNWNYAGGGRVVVRERRPVVVFDHDRRSYDRDDRRSARNQRSFDRDRH
jgi:hypothetical protein